MNFGKLYLVPNQLGDFNDNYIIKSHISLINKISFFIFENEKPGRAFIKNISPKKKQSELNSDEKVLEYGSISMNLDAHNVKIDGTEVILTALEFKLLKHLIKRKGRVQSRDQLLSDVWELSTEVTTRTVDTHIKRLRNKLGSMGKYVQTIRGVGYKFARIPD